MPKPDMAVQVFHTEDEGEAEKDTCKADNGTPISQLEAAKQQTLGKAAALLDKACPAILTTPSSDLPWSCHIAGLPQLKGFSGAAYVCLTSCADAKVGEPDSSRGGGEGCAWKGPRRGGVFPRHPGCWR